MTDGAGLIFSFAQFEFPWVIGPDPGRYVLRESASAPVRGVLVVATLGARPKGLFGGKRKPQRADAEPAPVEVFTSRVTLIDATQLESEKVAAKLLKEAANESEERLAEGLTEVNGLIRLFRGASMNPYVREVTRDQAMVARLGWGRGEEVADGLWSEAIEFPYRPEKQSRNAVLSPQERLAKLLGGHEQMWACEELVMRARMDLDQKRPREAALQVRVALEAALAELDAEGRSSLAKRREQLREMRSEIGTAANEAVAGDLSLASTEAVANAVTRLEGILRARALHPTTPAAEKS